MRRVLVIRTADKEFGELLAKNFNKDSDSFFQTFVFSEQEAFSIFAKTNIIDVLLCDEEILKEYCQDSRNRVENHMTSGELGLNDINAELVLALTELSTANEVCEMHSVFKYQASEKIMKEILYYYDQIKGPAIPEIKQETMAKKVCCVCSPVGGAYCSTFALALALTYSQSGKTLFVSFDPFFTLPGKNKNPKEKDLTDIIFYAGSNTRRTGLKEKLAEFINLCAVKYNELSMLNGVSHWFDICDLNIQIVHEILESTCNTGFFQNVVFDTGIFGAASMEILLMADTIYVPVNETVGARKKVDEWKRQIKYSGREVVLEKAKELQIPMDTGLKGEYEYDALQKGTLGNFIAYYNL